MRSRTLPALAVLVAVALPACSTADDPDPSGPGGTAPTQSSSAASAEPVACTTRPTATDGLTDPGQVLCLGTVAVLPVRKQSSGATGTMRLTVTGFDRGDDAQVDELLTSRNPEWTSATRDVWFVRSQGELLDESEPGAISGISPLGIGWQLQNTADVESESTLIIDEFTGCEGGFFADGGQGPVEACDFALLPPDAEPVALRWDELEAYADQPILWVPAG